MYELVLKHFKHGKLFGIELKEIEHYDFRKKNTNQIKKINNIDTTTIKKIIKYTKKNIHQIIIKQNIIKWFKKYIYKTKGICYTYPELSCNETEPVTQEPIQNIPIQFFLSFKEENTFYTFDIRYFHKINDFTNPYTRKTLPNNIIQIIKKQIYKLNNHKINLNYDSEPITTKQRAVSLFIDIDNLDNYTNVNWFLNLNSTQLKEWYKKAEDIWNYRARLTEEQKIKIVGNKKVFNIPVKEFQKINDHEKLRNLVLNEIDTLINTSQDKNERKLGCIYILIALTEVSEEAFNALYWLSI